MFSCWYEAHCWQCHDKNGLTSASPVSCGSTGAITPPLVTKLSLQTLLGELLGAPVIMPQSPTFTGLCHNIWHGDSHPGLQALRMRFKTSARKMTFLSGRRYGVVLGEEWVWDVWSSWKKSHKNHASIIAFSSQGGTSTSQFKYFHNRQISPRQTRECSTNEGKGRYRSK